MTDDILLAALQRIARGRSDCGRPLSGEAAREIARQALVESGNDDWVKPRPTISAQQGSAP